MQQIRKIFVIQLVFMAVFLSVNLASGVIATEHKATTETSTGGFLLDGTISYDHWYYRHTPKAADPNGVESAMNVSFTETVTVTAISQSLVKFEKQYVVNVSQAYCKQGAITVWPWKFGLRYYGKTGRLLAGDNSTSLIFNATRMVTEEGERTLSQNPYGATSVEVVAYFMGAVYNELAYTVFWLPDVGSPTSIFRDVSGWEEGEELGDFTVVGTGTLQGRYETWIIENEDIPQGTEVFTHRKEYEKISGLFTKNTYKVVNADEFHVEGNMQISELTGVINEAYVREGKKLPGFAGLMILAVALVSMIIIQRRKEKGGDLN